MRDSLVSLKTGADGGVPALVAGRAGLPYPRPQLVGPERLCKCLLVPRPAGSYALAAAPRRLPDGLASKRGGAQHNMLSAASVPAEPPVPAEQRPPHTQCYVGERAQRPPAEQRPPLGRRAACGCGE